MFKQSNLTTPRTLADSSFTIGHYGYRPEPRPTTRAMLVQGAIGVVLVAGLLAAMLGYFDVLVK